MSVPNLDLPTPQTLSDWCCARLKVPPGTWVSRRLWWGVKSGDWEFHQALKSALSGAAFPDLARQKVSALALSKLLYQSASVEKGGARAYYRPRGWSPLWWAELELRGDLEVLGRAFVARQGRNYYAQRLESLCAEAKKDAPTQHEKLETVARWSDEGLFAARDADFCAQFPHILENHALWLDEKGGERAILCGRDLREVSWPKGALKGADLRGILARGLGWSGDDLHACDARWGDFLGADLSDCDLREADFGSANLDLALLAGARRAGAKFDRWRRENRSFGSLNDLTDWDGTGARWNLSPTIRVELDFSRLNLAGRQFSNAENGLSGDLSFAQCVLREANFAGVSLFDANFRGAALQNADLRRANFWNGDFSGVDLQNANVWGAQFRECDFSGVDLSVLSNADFASFNGEAPRNCDFAGADFSKAQFYGRNFALCNFQGANFQNADLREANFAGANLENADFLGANLRKTVFIGANLRGARYSRWKMRRAVR